jgi:hypothetical protein
MEEQMVLRCIRAFGNFEPGDELTLPEEASVTTFDTYYFELVPDKPRPKGNGEDK